MNKRILALHSTFLDFLDPEKLLVNFGRGGVIVIQMGTTILVYLLSFLIRFDFSIPPADFNLMLTTLPLIVSSRTIFSHYFRVDMEWARFVSIKDLIVIFKATVWGSVGFIVLSTLFFRFQGFPRSIILLEALLYMMMTGGIRLIIRILKERDVGTIAKIDKHTIIVGADKAGVLVLNEIRSNPKLGMKVVGFVDDNVLMRGMEVQHTPVLGKLEDIPLILKKHPIDEIIIANPSASYKDLAKVIDLAEQNGVRAKILPDLGRIIQEGAYRGILKEVSYEELLGRKAIIFRRERDIKILEEEIEGKRILVTGAGGSIGSELCMHVARFKPAQLLLYDRYENTSYGCELKLKKEFPELNIFPIIGDILDRKKFRTVLKNNAIDLIYHAAAYKHVPLMERDPLEAIRNNIWGTYCVASEAVANRVRKFIMISTDKAVNPTSIMGASKRVAELIVQALADNGTQFISVRFGNVVGSDGSVLPLFKKQIMDGGPITITHPDVSRYFMSISEAVQLVMSAGALGKGGEIFLLDMGEPVKIVDVAKRMIEYMGLNPEKDIDIKFVGLRPGERLHEELFWKGEGIILYMACSKLLKPINFYVEQKFKL